MRKSFFCTLALTISFLSNAFASHYYEASYGLIADLNGDGKPEIIISSNTDYDYNIVSVYKLYGNVCIYNLEKAVWRNGNVAACGARDPGSNPA